MERPLRYPKQRECQANTKVEQSRWEEMRDAEYFKDLEMCGEFGAGAC